MFIWLIVITNNPDDVLAAVGTTVTLTCNASGTDNLKYQWMRKGNEPIISQAMGANTNSLTINNVTVDDSGKYKCAVSSGNATVVSKCGALSVVGKLHVISHNLSTSGLKLSQHH